MPVILSALPWSGGGIAGCLARLLGFEPGTDPATLAWFKS